MCKWFIKLVEVMFIDKEKKCKECLFEVKLDLYKILLDNFNFVVLEIVVE